MTGLEKAKAAVQNAWDEHRNLIIVGVVFLVLAIVGVVWGG